MKQANKVVAATALLWAGYSGSAIASEPIVHSFTSGANSIFSNAYVVETEHELVVVDATLLNSSSQQLRALVDGLHKPVKAILITHGHPDHYNGLTNLVGDQPIPIYSSQGVLDTITASDAAKATQWTPMFGAEWPGKRTFPNSVIKNGERLEVGGVTYSLQDMGKGESHSDSCWVMTAGTHKSVFVGDLVINGMHAYMSDGHSHNWLHNLDVAKKKFAGAEKIYPGHGDAGGLELFAWQKKYLTEYRTQVSHLLAKHKALTDEDKKQLTANMKQYLPTDKLEFLIALGADAVVNELSGTTNK